MTATTIAAEYFTIVQFTPEEAQAHDRRVYNVPGTTMLGWTPYLYRAMWRGHTSYFACQTEAELLRWLDQLGLTLKPWSPWNGGVRFTNTERAMSAGGAR